MNDLNYQINQIQKEIENLNSKLKKILFNINKKIENNSININEKIDGENIKFINKIMNGYSLYYLDNTIELFHSINNDYCVIYPNEYNSIISYDIIKNKKINEIKQAHYTSITNFRYFFDLFKRRDLILSISCSDNNLKLWDFKNWECLFNITNIYKTGKTYSACFLDINNNNNNNQYYIATSNWNDKEKSGPIKIFNFNGEKIKEIKDYINNENDRTFFLGTFFDIESSKNYIISGNKGFCKSYDFNNNKLYHKYYDEGDERAHLSFIIYEKDSILQLIESGKDGNIRIWDFHKGELLNKIKINDNPLTSICMLNKYFILIGCFDNSMKLLDLTNKKIVKQIHNFNDKVLTIKKNTHPRYGLFIISHDGENIINIYNYKNNINLII